MAITKEQLESKIKTIVAKTIHAQVLEGKEPFELYNAIVGTTFDAEGYKKVADEAPEYLYNHIPGGSKVNAKASVDVTGDGKVDQDDVKKVEEIIKKKDITVDDVKIADVTGDGKVDQDDVKKVEEVAAKSEVKIETKTEEPKVETPKVEEPKEEPKVETPKVEEPKEEPKVETPKVEDLDDPVDEEF